MSRTGQQRIVAIPAAVAAAEAFRASVAYAGDDTARVLAMPFGLTGTPALRPRRMHALGEDNAALLATDQPTRATA